MAPKVKFAFKPYPLQQDIIDHMEGTKKNLHGGKFRFFVVAIGRQSGKSWLAKYVGLDRAINRNQRVMWVSPSIPTARAHWDDLVNLVERSGIPTKRVSQAAKQIVFQGGGQISIRSAVEPDNLRGATVDLLILDEAAFFRNGEYVWFSICFPMVTASGGDVLFLSTPNGRNWFFNLFNQGNQQDEKYYKSWHAPSTVSPFQDKELLEVQRKNMPELQYREEFLAEFLADGSGIFSGAENAAVVDMIGVPVENHDYVAGIDFGFNMDATTFTVIDKYTREQVYGHRFYGFGTVGTIKRLVTMINHWKPEITHVEKNGIGESLFGLLKVALRADDEDINRLLQEKELDGEPVPEDDGDKVFRTEWGGKVRAIHMDNPTKRALVERLAADIEYGRLKTLKAVPASYGETQLNEMSTYLREHTQSGYEITYNAAEGSHDDTISGLYLAYKGVPKPAKFGAISKKADLKGRVNPFKHHGKLRPHRKGLRNAKRD